MRGNHATLVISLKTANGPVSRCTNAALDAMYFTAPGSISAYLAENSYGLMTLSGTVTGPYVIPLAQGWSRSSVADQADSAATAAGVNLSLYSQKVYVLPKEADPDPIHSG